jgi:hypothetical protein
MDDSEKKEIRKIRYQVRTMTRQAQKMNEDLSKIIKQFKESVK